VPARTATGKTSAEPVAAVLVRHDSDLYDLRVATAHGTAVIDTTRNHLFWDTGRHRWVKAAALKYGTRLRTPAGATATALGGHDPKATTGWMWDLSIPGGNDHDFYVLPGDSEGAYYHSDEHGVAAVLVHNVNDPCDIPTLKSYARQIRLSGDTQRAVNSRVIAVGQDEAGSLTAGSSNGFDIGMQTAADDLGIRIMPSINGQHAEEDLLLDNRDTLWPLKRVASDNQGACGPESHDCAGQMDNLGIEHN
jgi:hypothetical protein